MARSLLLRACLLWAALFVLDAKQAQALLMPSSSAGRLGEIGDDCGLPLGLLQALSEPSEDGGDFTSLHSAFTSLLTLLAALLASFLLRLLSIF